jgi:hypothetical protein
MAAASPAGAQVVSQLNVALCVSVLGALTASTARAQGVDEFGAYGTSERHWESSQDFALELRLGPYRPRIDDEFSGATPYRDVFGTGTRLMIGTEFDWQVLDVGGIGSLGPGVGIGYTRMSARAAFADGSGLSSEDTSLIIVPLWAAAVFRVDALARQTPVPLAFYGKAGLATGLWWVKDGDGTAVDDNGVRGKGRSDGWMIAGGLMLDLGFIDEESSRQMDVDSGINHSYLFGELMALGLGASDSMRVGANTWLAGLAFEL